MPPRRRLPIYAALAVVLPVAVAAGVLGWLLAMPNRRAERVLERPGAVDAAVVERLRRHVRTLAGDIGARVAGEGDGLQRAAAYITAELAAMGLRPDAQAYTVSGMSVQNVEVVVPPGHEAVAPALVVGAHYDTDPVAGTPGADDNASGVALLLELARALAGSELARPVRLVAFACEEAPYFQSDGMGSVQYVRRLQGRGFAVPAMISLESLGYFRDRPGSQRYPIGPLSAFFPDRGNFVAVVGNLASRSFADEVARLLIAHSALPVESGSFPEWVPGIGWSDHWAFWQGGGQAVMLTDTAPFRNPHYHQRSDRPATLDYPAMGALATALAPVVVELVRRRR